MEYDVPIEDSMLATVGNKLSWVFYPVIGERNWGATVSAVQGLVAKEQVVSSMAVIAGFEEEEEEGDKIFNESSPFGSFTAAAAYAFMVFNLFSAPCFGAIGAMKRELGGTKNLLKAVGFQTGLAWILATCVYQIGSRLELGTISIIDILLVTLIVIIMIAIIIRQVNKKSCDDRANKSSYDHLQINRFDKKYHHIRNRLKYNWLT